MLRQVESKWLGEDNDATDNYTNRHVLILGFWLPWAVLLSNLILLTFLGALVFNLSRGLDIHCACFSTSQQSPSLCMCLYVIRDVIFFLLGLYLLSHIILQKRRAFAATKP